MIKSDLIPEISDKELANRMNFLVPCVLNPEDGILYECLVKKKSMLRNFSFNYMDNKQDIGRLRSDGSVSGYINLKFCFEIVTAHTWDFYGFFKPTISEVLAQIPENIMSQIRSNNAKPYFFSKAITDKGDGVTIINHDYHIARTKFFIRES